MAPLSAQVMVMVVVVVVVVGGGRRGGLEVVQFLQQAGRCTGIFQRKNVEGVPCSSS